MKINIVKFKDGRYAIMKRGSFGKKFHSVHSDYWWGNTYNIDRFCKTTKKQAEKIYEMLTDEGVIIK